MFDIVNLNQFRLRHDLSVHVHCLCWPRIAIIPQKPWTRWRYSDFYKAPQHVLGFTKWSLWVLESMKASSITSFFFQKCSWCLWNLISKSIMKQQRWKTINRDPKCSLSYDLKQFGQEFFYLPWTSGYFEDFLFIYKTHKKTSYEEEWNYKARFLGLCLDALCYFLINA